MIRRECAYNAGNAYTVADTKGRDARKRCASACPHTGGGIVIGVIVILFGLALLLRQVYGIALETWPFIVIFIGILMIAGAITRSLRKRESTNS